MKNWRINVVLPELLRRGKTDSKITPTVLLKKMMVLMWLNPVALYILVSAQSTPKSSKLDQPDPRVCELQGQKRAVWIFGIKSRGSFCEFWYAQTGCQSQAADQLLLVYGIHAKVWI